MYQNSVSRRELIWLQLENKTIELDAEKSQSQDDKMVEPVISKPEKP